MLIKDALALRCVQQNTLGPGFRGVSSFFDLLLTRWRARCLHRSLHSHLCCRMAPLVPMTSVTLCRLHASRVFIVIVALQRFYLESWVYYGELFPTRQRWTDLMPGRGQICRQIAFSPLCRLVLLAWINKPLSLEAVWMRWCCVCRPANQRDCQCR